MRLDKFLKISRLIKRRTIANEACDAGRVMVNGKVAKASVNVKVGDIIEIQFGEKTVKIRAVPLEAADGNIEDLFFEILKNLSQNKKSDMTEKMKNAIYQISCKGAVKANMKLDEKEMKTLLDNVFALSGINTCPHGRPITISFTKYFIEKQFKRIV